MKVGILSLPMWNNYGGILQTYALQTILRDLGHETIYVNRQHPKLSALDEKKVELKTFIKKNIMFKKNITVYPNHHQREKISQNTFDFIEKEIKPISGKLYSNSDLQYLKSELIDAYIVGSDQVWRPKYVPNIFNYYLDFVDDEALKISYAASFGTDAWEYSLEQEMRCKELLKRFDNVSVREDSAINLCTDKYDVNTTHVLDPTLLIDKEKYVELIDKYEDGKSEGNLFTYILDENNEAKQIIKKVANKLDLKSFKVMPKVFDVNFNINDDAYDYPSLTKWLQAINDANFIIADSFHGCVFAILFNKPFIAIGNKSRGLSRFTSLFKMFNLEDRLILNLPDLSESKIAEPINWDEVNSILKVKREESINFLIDSLQANE